MQFAFVVQASRLHERIAGETPASQKRIIETLAPQKSLPSRLLQMLIFRWAAADEPFGRQRLVAPG